MDFPHEQNITDWFLLEIVNSPDGFKPITPDSFLNPISALVGSDGKLYWNREDVTCLFKDDNLPDLRGEDVLEPNIGSIYERKCQLLSTEQVYSILQDHSKILAALFDRALTQGKGIVTYDKGIYMPFLRIVPMLRLGETSFPSWIKTFIEKQLALRKKPDDGYYNSENPWFSLAINDQSISALVGDDGKLYWTFEEVCLLLGIEVDFPPDGVYGKDIIMKWKSKHRLITTKQLYELLFAHNETFAIIVDKMLTQGEGIVTRRSGNYHNLYMCMLTLADTCFPSWIKKFTEDQITSRRNKS